MRENRRAKQRGGRDAQRTARERMRVSGVQRVSLYTSSHQLSVSHIAASHLVSVVSLLGLRRCECGVERLHLRRARGTGRHRRGDAGARTPAAEAAATAAIAAAATAARGHDERRWRSEEETSAGVPPNAQRCARRVRRCGVRAVLLLLRIGVGCAPMYSLVVSVGCDIIVARPHS
jgi:hypothetical protein